MQDTFLVAIVGSLGEMVAIDMELFSSFPIGAERAIGIRLQLLMYFKSTFDLSYRFADKTCHGSLSLLLPAPTTHWRRGSQWTT